MPGLHSKKRENSKTVQDWRRGLQRVEGRYHSAAYKRSFSGVREITWRKGFIGKGVGKEWTIITEH